MSNEIAVPNAADLAAEIDYAKALAPAALLPAAYRGRPADVLVAIGLGKAIGIPPAQALWECHVVNGRPAPSANLMAALARRAGHKLRIEGDATRCTATLIRADDPEFPFVATWTIEQAKTVGLASKDIWKQYPGAMLRSRAIAEVVRMGASEAVLGMDYASEELRDTEPAATAPVSITQPGLAALRAAVVEPVVDVTDAEVIPDEPNMLTDKQRGAIFGGFDRAGFDTDPKSAEGKAVRLAYITKAIGRPVESTNDLTHREAGVVLDMLTSDAARNVDHTTGEVTE